MKSLASNVANPQSLDPIVEIDDYFSTDQIAFRFGFPSRFASHSHFAMRQIACCLTALISDRAKVRAFDG
jgi:hypothetical protein